MGMWEKKRKIPVSITLIFGLRQTEAGQLILIFLNSWGNNSLFLFTFPLVLLLPLTNKRILRNTGDFQFCLVTKYIEVHCKFISKNISSLMNSQDFQLRELFFCFRFLMFYPQNIWVLLIEIILFEM